MKSQYKSLLIAGIIALSLCSCTTNETYNNLVMENLESYKEEYSENNGSLFTDEINAVINDEIEPTNSEIHANVQQSFYGRYLTNAYEMSDNRLYFTINNDAGYGLISYVDTETGMYSILCNDPLCKHDDCNKCEYLGFQEISFASENTFFAWKTSGYPVFLYRGNLADGTMKNVHTPSTVALYPIGTDKSNGKLYYFEVMQNQEEDRKVIQIYNLYCFDDETGKVNFVGSMPDEYSSGLGQILFIVNDRLWFLSMHTLYSADIEFKDVRVEYEAGTQYFDFYYYDTYTDELFFTVNDDENFVGSLYRLSNGKAAIIDMPHDNIYSFSLTDDKIYYSVYNPTYLGVSADPGRSKVYDYTGGIVYETDRERHDSANVAYDCKGEFMICNANHPYTVVNGVLYFDEIRFVREIIDGVEYSYFSSAGKVNKIAVKLSSGEIARISID